MKPPGSPKSNKGDVKFTKQAKDKAPNEQFEKDRKKTQTKITKEGLSVKPLDSLSCATLEDDLA